MGPNGLLDRQKVSRVLGELKEWSEEDKRYANDYPIRAYFDDQMSYTRERVTILDEGHQAPGEKGCVSVQFTGAANIFTAEVYPPAHSFEFSYGHEAERQAFSDAIEAYGCVTFHIPGGPPPPAQE